MFVGEVIFFYFARLVLNVIYKKELPGGEDLATEFGKMLKLWHLREAERWQMK